MIKAISQDLDKIIAGPSRLGGWLKASIYPQLPIQTLTNTSSSMSSTSDLNSKTSELPTYKVSDERFQRRSEWKMPPSNE